MLKRLIIAVFVMGLVMCLSGTAFSDVDNDRYKGLEKYVPSNPSNPNYKDGVTDPRPAPSPLRAIPGDPTEFTVLSSTISKPITPPSGYFCDVTSNEGPWTVAYGLPGSGGLRTSLASRFTGEAGNYCTVKAAYVYLNPPVPAGGSGLKVFLYDDNGFGLPGLKLDSVMISNACLLNLLCTPNVGGALEVHAVFTNGPWEFSGTEQWHIAVERDGALGVFGVLGDAGGPTMPYFGQNRGSVYRTDLPGWATAATYFPGTDRNFAIYSEKCCGVPFTDCHTLSYWSDITYAFNLPNLSGTRTAHAERFSTTGPETLKSADVYVYFADPGVDIKVSVYANSGTLPTGAPLASVTVPNGSLVFFPAAQNFDFSAFNLVFDGDFHIAVEAPGAIPNVQYAAMLADDEAVDPTGRGSVFHLGVWKSVLAGVGIDVDFLIDANLCRDEFALCSIDNDNYTTINYALRLPRPDPGFGITGYAQQFAVTGGAQCKLKEIGIWFQWNAADGARSLYDSNVIVSAYTDAGGLPGSSLGSYQITQADFTAAGDVGYTGSTYLFYVLRNVDPLNIYGTGQFWIVLRSKAVSFAAGGARPMMDIQANANAPMFGSAVESTEWPNPPFPAWDYQINYWGDPNMDGSEALFMDLRTCCTPFAEYTCLTPQDWSTPGGSFARTGRSNASLSDAYCDLNRLWSYTSPTSDATWSGPVIYNGRLIQVFTDRVVQFDLLTGGINWTLGPGAPYGTDMRCVPTAATIDIAGTPTDVVFLITGNQRAFICVNWITGVPIWTQPGPNGAGGGAARWGITSVANQAGTEVVYHCTEISRVVARVAATGALYGGWATNPVVLAGAASEVTNTYNANDNLLYVATIPAAGNGDVYALNGATGAVVWQLSTAGLQGQAIWNAGGATVNTSEGFSGHIAYDGGIAYINSRSGPISDGDQFPADGAYYRVNALTGAIVSSRQSQAVYRSGPILDQNNVIIPTRSNWINGPVGGSLIAISKGFNTATWTYDHPSGQGLWTAGLITCEPAGEPDQVYVYGDRHFMSAVDANTGVQNWERRMDNGAANMDLTGFLTSTSVALSKTGELAITDEFGGVAVLSKGVDRARMQFITYRPGGAVNFGANVALPVNAGWFMKNTGCVPLTIATSQVDATSPTGQILPAFAKPVVIGDDLLNASSSISDKMAKFSEVGKWGMMINSNVSETSNEAGSREFVNRAALSGPPPAWFVSLDQPKAGDVIMPGDSMELLVTVNQPLITRGNNSAYLSYTSNDPDFFLNDPPKAAEARLTLIGGCIADTTDLHFGMGSANYQHVWNTGRLGHGDHAPSHGFHIDGNDASYYQGSYIYSVTAKRWAASSADWTASTTLEWVSLQGDPNWCDTTCKAALVSPYPVPAISSDGLTYNPIAASMVCRSYIDSVQNFFNGAVWSVTLNPAPFDNDSTMGLYVKSRVIGATNNAGLANVTIDLMEINERNGDSVPNWYFGSYNDYDIGATDTSGIDKSISTAYAWNKAAANGIWGQIKLPFGCGQTPVINTHGMQGAQALYPPPNNYFDSQYIHMTRVAAHTSTIVTGGDFEQHNTFVKKDFGPNETISFGVAHFGFPTQPHGGSGNTAPAIVKNLATLVNKWTGWGRGDVNNDAVINLADIVYLAGTVNFGGPGAIPFAHLGDVDASGGAPTQADVTYLSNFYFNCGPCPAGDWTM
jgi:PQQ-like domain